MPELPEVEVLRRSLEPSVVGSRVRRVRVWRTDLREPVDKRRLARSSGGRRIVGVRRRAKYLLLDLERDTTLVIHLGMSGRLTLAPADAAREPHEHVGIDLDDGRRLRFRDPRRFGLILACPTGGLERARRFAHLGLEPLAEGFDGERLRQLAVGRKAPVKAFLMDARVVVGLGNIYVAEALHLAGIHPRRSVARISAARWDRLATAVQATLEEAIAQGGTTLSDFTNALGQSGYFRVALSVYDREGRPCRRCGTAIRRTVQAGRSTYYCPRCQH